ncbi:MAG TPA: histidinol dehydrogenase [Fibrobacteria bacterium]|nr:histidinol dehydrogenase [Fibrobacteria bacterium]
MKTSQPMRIVRVSTLNHPDVRGIVSREPSPSPEITGAVKDILAGVKTGGHAAALGYARKFDGLKGNLAVSQAELEKKAGGLDPQVKRAIKGAIANVRRFHERQAEKSWTFTGPDGETLGQIIRPLDRVGLYVPGGAGAYPSTLIMNAVPARVAGVREIAVVTPASKGLHPAIAFAARELGITEVYRIGGAQAVAMLAFGTAKVRRVDKIVGPGNVYATLAKKEVFGTVDIDMIAGPSEILVLADETADPDWVAADLLSQAEHGSGYEAALCITTSAKAAAWIADCVAQQVEASPKRAVLEKSLSRFGRIYLVPDWKFGCALADAIAPEHLEILTAEPEALSARIKNAGAIFLGSYSSEPVGDYFAGPNHVLPTNGSARFFSPLGAYDFYKRTSLIRYTPKAMRKHGPLIAALADAEGFHHHAQAVRKRL